MALYPKLIGAGGVEHPIAETTRIGRSLACEIVIDDKKVSRTHAKIGVDEVHRVVLEDLGSTNGTWVNGLRIAEPVTLGHGDEVRFHRHRFILALQPGDQPQSRLPRAPRSSDRPSHSAADRDSGLDASKVPPALARKATGAHMVVPDNDGGRVVELMERRDAVWTIGRNESCDVVLTEKGVSGRHAQLLHNRGRWRLVNLVSASSTLVNGKRSQKTFLVDGDEIRLGLATIVFHTADELVGFSKWRLRLRRLVDRFPKVFLIVRVAMAPLVFIAWFLNTDFDSIMQMVDHFLQRVANLMP